MSQTDDLAREEEAKQTKLEEALREAVAHCKNCDVEIEAEPNPSGIETEDGSPNMDSDNENRD